MTVHQINGRTAHIKRRQNARKAVLGVIQGRKYPRNATPWQCFASWRRCVDRSGFLSAPAGQDGVAVAFLRPIGAIANYQLTLKPWRLCRLRCALSEEACSIVPRRRIVRALESRAAVLDRERICNIRRPVAILPRFFEPWKSSSKKTTDVEAHCSSTAVGRFSRIRQSGNTRSECVTCLG